MYIYYIYSFIYVFEMYVYMCIWLGRLKLLSVLKFMYFLENKYILSDTIYYTYPIFTLYYVEKNEQ